jgi:two-component system cell cycle sensor histidine kinase/response regulator CckA
MAEKPTYEALEKRIKELEKEASELKLAKEALKESEEKYRHLTESLLDTVYEFDRKGRFTYVNEAGTHMFGYSKEEILNGLRVQDTMAEEVRDLSQKVISEIFKGNTTSGERTFLRKDGTQFMGQIHSGPIYEGNDVVGVRGVLRDITEQKQAEEALRESELKFRGLFDLSPQAIAVTEVETGRLIDVNDTFCKVTKHDKEEVLGRTTTELGFYSKEDRDRFIGKLQPKGEIYGLEMDFKAKDDSIINSVMFAKYIQLKGKTFIITTFLDMTERKRLEAQLQQAHKMEAIGTLAGGIAHDFNNLLMGILGSTSLMLFNITSKHPHYESLKNVEQHVQSGAKLTKQLLGIARGGMYEAKPTDLNRLLEKTSEMFSRTSKDIKVYTKYQTDIWPVEVDQNQIEQVLLNLYVNAWQAMPNGGDLYLQSENVFLDEEHVRLLSLKSGKCVRLTIADTGVGMDEVTIQRIFDPFFTTKEIGRGTGLGLASVYGIIKNHDGIIDVFSKKGEGATFTIYLPASDKQIIEEKEMPREVLKGVEMVLLVDDEDSIVDVGEEILHMMGYQVLSARSGKEALELYQKSQATIDIVVLDMIMPEMGGEKTYDKLKEINPKVKVLLSSGYSIDGKAKEILEKGCDGFIQKPFTIEELSQKIREVLDKK